jgi:hypothetical protein
VRCSNWQRSWQNEKKPVNENGLESIFQQKNRGDRSDYAAKQVIWIIDNKNIRYYPKLYLAGMAPIRRIYPQPLSTSSINNSLKPALAQAGADRAVHDTR